MNNQIIATFKSGTQKQVIETLECYDRVSVTLFANGEERVSTGTIIKSSYSAAELTSTRVEILASELFTAQERNENYKKSFGYLPYPLFI